ncbi:TPA: hypothetical protein MO340_004277 [Salmonella enterica subsp. salamae serovar 35:g,m,s,t:-]|nr:hypothetical protein [Salmonella enterica subsp. salamae serovar 35:g,m,s,t:-]HCA3549747.1 hypothetical protein [Salmonella enterica subsp. salamae serovar 35:g,m,s,t:-]
MMGNNEMSETNEDEGLTTVIIGLINAVNWKTDNLDMSPFPEMDLDMHIPGQGIIWAAEHNADGKRAVGGVIETHYSTSKWEFVLERYKEYMKVKEKQYSYIFILVNSALVYHEIIAANLI